MKLRRALRRALGEGALAGVAAGTLIGLWSVRLSHDFAHGMPWLAAERTVPPAAWLGLYAMGGSLVLAGMAVLLRRQRPAGRRAAAVAMAGCVTVAAIAVFMTRNAIFPLAAGSSSPRLTLAVVAAVIICGLLLVAARLRDLFQDADENLPEFQRRTLHLAGLGACLLAAAWLALLAGPFINNLRAKGLPSVIVVSIDTLRADRMGVLGASPSLTPLLDELAREGTLFTQAQATAPWTLPSHTSLFTSMLPFDHHVRWSWMRIAPDHAMLAEHFRAAGYRTAAFTGGGYVAGHFGFNQGFEIYEDHDEIEEGGPEIIADHALRWVRQIGEQPYFLFVHTYEPHSPFLHAGPGSPATHPGRLAAGVTFTEVDAIHSGEMVLTEDERRHVINLYDGDVAHADRVIGGLLHTLRAEGRLDNTILIVLSDHGEDLWDHSDVRSPGHGHNLYQELIHVPLIVRAPGRVPGGHRLQTPVSLLDVAPTLLALAGLPPDPHHLGRSLETALLTATEPPQVPVLAESVEYGPDRFMRREGDLKVVLTPTPGILHNNVRLQVPPLEIFDLSSDPGEHHNLVVTAGEDLAEAARTLVAELRERARLKLFGDKSPAGAEQDLPPELEEQLRSLGYIQ